MLGGFRVWVGGHPVDDGAWRRRKPAALLKQLALASEHRLHRELLMETLWPELEAEPAAANLRKAVFHARAALNNASPGGGDVVAVESDVIVLRASPLEVDTEELRALLAAARRGRDPAAYQQAVALYRGELLPDDRYDDWAESPRQELHVECVAALAELAALLEARGALAEAIDAARRGVALEPCDEESHATLMRLYMLAGRRADALRQYQQLRHVLDEQLGMEPEPATQRLYEEIRARQEPAPELSAELWERVGDLRVLSGDRDEGVRSSARAGDVTSIGRLERKCGEAWLMQHRPDMAAPHLAAAGAAPFDAA